MDVVSDSHDLDKLWVYMINHRLPLDGHDGKVSMDSVVEVFSTRAGSQTLKHISTIENPIINTPNDIIGQSDGKACWFTNDHGAHTGFVRPLDCSCLVIFVHKTTDSVRRGSDSSLSQLGWTLQCAKFIRSMDVQDRPGRIGWCKWYSAMDFRK